MAEDTVSRIIFKWISPVTYMLTPLVLTREKEVSTLPLAWKKFQFLSFREGPAVNYETFW